MASQKILVIEDERSLTEILTYNLEREGFEVVSAADGQEGIRLARAETPDLILLDLMLPVIDGLEVCRQLRADPRLQGVRILMLTARSEEVDEIVGFSTGADDYVTKPFKIKPLISRVRALLRRPEGAQTAVPEAEPSSADVINSQGLEIDRVYHRVRADGEELQLTPTEFKLLWTLARSPGRPFSRNELMDRSRGEDANALERTIDVHVRSLRQKLGERGDLIETVRGIGYRFRPERATAASESRSEK